jgi:FkbM family methyltransferase
VLTDFDGDLKFRVDRACYMGSLIYWRGYHSLSELMCLDELLRPPMVFADVGANQGEFTTFAAKRLTEGSVLAFEPLEENYRILTENVELNRFSNVLRYNFGLSDQPDEVEVFASPDVKLHGGWNETATMFPTDSWNTRVGRVRVEVFDEVFPETGLKRLDGMKIDVEGAELPVLRGASQAIQRHRPFIIMEICDETYQAAGYCKSDVCQLLRDMGYRLFVIRRGGRRTPASVEQLPHFCNTLWLPQERC